MKKSLKNTKNNEKTNTTMKPATLNTKVLKQDEKTVYISLEQLNNNRDLISQHDNILRLKKDGREVIVCLPITQNTFCPVNILMKLMVDEIRIDAELLDRYTNAETRNTDRDFFAMNTTYRIAEDLADGISENYKNYYFKDIKKDVMSELAAIKNSGKLPEIVSAVESMYPKEAGNIKLFTKSVNRAMLANTIYKDSLLAVSCMYSIDFFEEKHNPKFYKRGLSGYVVAAMLCGKNHEDTIQFVQKHVNDADRESIEYAINRMTIM